MAVLLGRFEYAARLLAKTPRTCDLIIKLAGTTDDLIFTRKGKLGGASPGVEDTESWLQNVQAKWQCAPTVALPASGAESFTAVQDAHCRIPGVPGSWLTKCQKRYPVDMTTTNIYFRKPLEGREIMTLVGTT